LRFVTYTLKYNHAAWLTVEAVDEHYRRATVEATIKDDVVNVAAQNVRVLAIDPRAASSVRFGEDVFPLARNGGDKAFFIRQGTAWKPQEARAFLENAERGKRHELQGPIDDAFTGPFLCVRGTGTPWNPEVAAWADARLEQFAALWAKRLRGELPVKRDTEVTDQDIARHHIVLFGDPGSIRLRARVLGELPLGWTRAEVGLAGTFPAAGHVPVCIAPNPLNPRRYVVVNSGHTFDEAAFAGSNSLLYPRLGDYAVLQIGAGKDKVKVSGYFDERWKLK
jgi:hypothetical protein